MEVLIGKSTINGGLFITTSDCQRVQPQNNGATVSTTSVLNFLRENHDSSNEAATSNDEADMRQFN
jgi:hypothetical protein